MMHSSVDLIVSSLSDQISDRLSLTHEHHETMRTFCQYCVSYLIMQPEALARIIPYDHFKQIIKFINHQPDKSEYQLFIDYFALNPTQIPPVIMMSDHDFINRLIQRQKAILDRPSTDLQDVNKKTELIAELHKANTFFSSSNVIQQATATILHLISSHSSHRRIQKVSAYHVQYENNVNHMLSLLLEPTNKRAKTAPSDHKKEIPRTLQIKFDTMFAQSMQLAKAKSFFDNGPSIHETIKQLSLKDAKEIILMLNNYKEILEKQIRKIALLAIITDAAVDILNLLESCRKNLLKATNSFQFKVQDFITHGTEINSAELTIHMINELESFFAPNEAVRLYCLKVYQLDLLKLKAEMTPFKPTK